MADEPDYVSPLWTAQPAPEPNTKPIVHEVAAAFLRECGMPELAEEMIERGEYGARKYGTPLQPGNGRRWDRDLFEEDLDGLAYAMQGALEGDGDMRAEFLTRAATAERARVRAMVAR